MKTIRGHVGQGLWRLAHSFYSLFIDFIYPPFCLICHNRIEPDAKFVCTSCWDSFHLLEQPLLSIDQLNLLGKKKKYFSQSLAIYEYTEAIQKLIHVMKYKSMPGIAARFGYDLGNLIQKNSLLQNVDVLIPVPLHALRYRERGYNQASLIAREIGRITQTPVHEKVLKRVRYTGQQAKYNKEERAQNVRDAFRVVDVAAVRNRNIILVDDVLTTGSTMNECAKVLETNGAGEITTITIVRI